MYVSLGRMVLGVGGRVENCEKGSSQNVWPTLRKNLLPPFILLGYPENVRCG